MMIDSVVWEQHINVTDTHRQTDRQTDSHIATATRRFTNFVLLLLLLVCVGRQNQRSLKEFAIIFKHLRHSIVIYV